MADHLLLTACTSADQAGGKAVGLARLLQAGLPVPPGIVLTTAVFDRLATVGIRHDAALMSQLRESLAKLGGNVAVRSSATGEDARHASHAGQYVSTLNIRTEGQLFDAIEACWQSVLSPGVRHYRERMGDTSPLKMAVIVQQMVNADCSGVFFSHDPLDTTGESMLIAAAFGPGGVVQGQGTPTQYRLQRTDGRVLQRTEQDARLNDAQLATLVELGRRAEVCLAEPCDVEWAYADEQFWLLQARPLQRTAYERERLREQVILAVAKLVPPEGACWIRDSFTEQLPAPTPMTWAVVERWLAADGGLGALHRDLGGEPDPALGSRSAYDLIASRPMCELGRLPRLQFARPHFYFPVPDVASGLPPQPVLAPVRRGFSDWLRLPQTLWRVARQKRFSQRQKRNFPQRFMQEIVPAFETAARAELARDWSSLDDRQVLAQFHDWTQRTLIEFGREALKPAVFAEQIWGELAKKLSATTAAEKARQQLLSLPTNIPDNYHLVRGLRHRFRGIITHEEFLQHFGHRGLNELELAEPRWSETPEFFARLHSPSSREESIRPSVDDTNLHPLADELRRFLGLREIGKQVLMIGYAILRKALLELDRRHGLHDGIFFLLPAELHDLLAGKDLLATLAERRQRRAKELTLEVPAVLESDHLQAIGMAVLPESGVDFVRGVPVSPGAGEGRALVVQDLAEVPADARDFVLVCPRCDPGGVPVYGRARAIIAEQGSVLSHSAIILRELGIPAVFGIPAACRLFTPGEHLRIDGTLGIVTKE